MTLLPPFSFSAENDFYRFQMASNGSNSSTSSNKSNTAQRVGGARPIFLQPRSSSGFSQAKGVASSPPKGTFKAPSLSTVRAGPVTRAITKNLPGQFPFVRGGQRQSAVFQPQASSTERKSYLTVATTPPPRSPVASPSKSPQAWKLTLVPAMIKHFGKHGYPSTPPRARGIKSSPTISPLKPSSVVKITGMVTQAKTVEEQLAELRTAVKEQHEQIRAKDALILARDAQIAKMMEKLEIITANMGDVSQAANRNRATTSASADQHPDSPEVLPLARELRFEEPGTLTLDALNVMISNAVRSSVQAEENQSQTYIRPYSRRIQALRFSAWYSPPKFQLFNGDGNPKQHIAHFVETCNNAGTNSDLLVRLFGRSLKGNAFDWYIELPQESIDSWKQLEHEFLNRFYSTVTLVELTNLK